MEPALRHSHLFRPSESVPDDFAVEIVSEDLARNIDDESFVTRVWTRSRRGVRLLCDYIIRSQFDAVLIQHHPGIIGWEDLAFIVEALSGARGKKIAVFVQ